MVDVELRDTDQATHGLALDEPHRHQPGGPLQERLVGRRTRSPGLQQRHQTRVKSGAQDIARLTMRGPGLLRLAGAAEELAHSLGAEGLEHFYVVQGHRDVREPVPRSGVALVVETSLVVVVLVIALRGLDPTV
eukprot:CAMPEP_0185796346 /NCGR_PEP_ID=MMETSP1174-20130828/161028_1 /TAXON_ID=35687 /ORGANISM="Dictyocha speculum, Strain CCMP1381" /LENGTH=133 /DNA_ID=CAMNT_0028491701 /DNA_START=451 /DNA_END=852 /DNA_ORIENTATION=-